MPARPTRDDETAEGAWRERLLGPITAFIAEVNRDRLPGLAAETAFFVVLGIFPALLVAASLLGTLDTLLGADVAAQAQQTIVSAVDLVLTDQASGALRSVEELFEQTRGGLLTVALLGALVTVSGAFAVVVNALNIAYDTAERRSWLRRRLLGLAMGVGTILVVAVGLALLVVGPLLGRGQTLADSVGLGGTFETGWDAARVPLVLVGVAAWLTTLFHLAPSRRTRWRDAVPGAVATCVLWVLASAGFHLYLRLAAGGNPVLGVFGGGIIVMTWVYLLCLALLLGGELNSMLMRRWALNPPHGAGRRAGGGPRP